MSLKFTAGLCKKIGMPDYGSLGASCQVEVHLDESFSNNPGGIQQAVEQAYAACRQAVDEELARQQGATSEHAGHGKAASPAPAARPRNGQANGPSGHRASQKQLDYIEQLAGQIPGLGARQLEALATKMFDKPVGELASLEASALIDTLKEIKAGKIELAAAVSGDVA